MYIRILINAAVIFSVMNGTDTEARQLSPEYVRRRYRRALSYLSSARSKLDQARGQANYIQNWAPDDQWRKNSVQMDMESAHSSMRAARRLVGNLHAELAEMELGCGQAYWVARVELENWRCNAIAMSAESASSGIDSFEREISGKLEALEQALEKKP